MFDPEMVETAEVLQRACPQWLIFWSPALRAFTAIPLFVPDQLVVINEPLTHTLLKRIGAVELAASVGAPISGPIDVGAQCRTDAGRPSPPSETDPPVRPHHPRSRHSPGGGHASSRARNRTEILASILRDQTPRMCVGADFIERMQRQS
jgi:hypothetical protein